MPPTDTKTALLDAAEILFAERGFADTSLRELTTRARANLAAVNYHFGGKEELAVAVLSRRFEPINAERLARLELLGKRPTVVAIVRAFVEPVLLGTPGLPGGAGAVPGFCRLFGRLMVEQPPFLRTFLTRQFRELVLRFEHVLKQALPRADGVSLWWRLHFLVGAMAHTLQNAESLMHLSDGRCRHDDTERILAELVAFTAAGLAADGGRTAAAVDR